MAPISTEDFERLLQAYLDIIHINLVPGQASLLCRHLNLLIRWNQKLNLTSVMTPPQIVDRHFAESLFLANLLKMDTGTIVDVGSGAGFPGFPIAVLKPSTQVSLVESIAKKAAFLKELCRGSPNTSVIHGRFETLALAFDWGVVRGVLASRLLPEFVLRLKHLALIVGQETARDLSATEYFESVQSVPLPWKPNRVVLLTQVRHRRD